MGSIDLLRVGDGHYELLYPKNSAALAAINAETNNAGVPTGPLPAPKALEAPRLATILAAKSPAERAIADNCLLRPALRAAAKKAIATKVTATKKLSPTRSVTVRKPPVKMLSRFEENMKRATAASLAQLKVEAEKPPTLRRRPVVAPGPNASRNTVKKANVVNKLANALNKTRLNNKRNRSSSFENALEAIEEQKRAEALAIKRKEASIKAAVMKAKAANIVAAKKAAAAAKKIAAAAKKNKNNESNNEEQALALQIALEASMNKLKIKNNKNK